MYSKDIKTKNVFLVVDLPKNSGIGRYGHSLFKSLRKLGINVCLYQLPHKLLINKVTTLTLELNIIYNAILKYSSILKTPKSASLYHIINPALSILSKKVKPSVVTVHDMLSIATPRSPMDFLLIRNAMRYIPYAERIVCVSESTKNDLLRFIDVDPKRVRVIYYGVDHKLFRPRDKLEARRKLRLPLSRPMILNVGSEEPRKNVPTLLKSFRELLNDIPNALLVRVGERTARIEKLIKTLGLTGKVLYRRASPTEVAFYYNAADALCFPSYYEGFGNPPLEAMASGLPVITSNRTSIPEVVGDAGILLDPFDIDGFAYWAGEILTNEDLKAELSRKGYKRSMSFSWKKCARETLEVYKEVTG